MKNLKKLIFIDNDMQKRAEEDVDYVKDNLEHNAHLPSQYISTMEIVPDFFRLSKAKASKILFSKENCICSFSMYTENHYGSMLQLISFLRASAKNNISGIVYVDCSGELQKKLERKLDYNKKYIYEILTAIETNYIISFDNDDDYKCYRLRVELGGLDESPFKKEEVNLLELLSLEN